MPLLTEHSEEAREILGKLPKWIIRSGISVIFLIFLSILFIAYFIRWPDTVSAPLTVNTFNPPVDLTAGAGGMIDTFLIKEGEPVVPGQDIVVFESGASYDDVMALERLLHENDETSDVYLSEEILEPGLKLGDHLQSGFMSLRRVCLSYQYYMKVSQIQLKKQLLQDKIERQRVSLDFQRRQYELARKDQVFVRRNYSRDSLLYNKYQSMSEADLERSERSLLQNEISMISQQASLYSSEASILSLQEQLVDLDMQYDREINQFEMQLADARTNLLRQLHEWREHYVISSPIAGKATFLNYWSRNQSVDHGARFATVIPLEPLTVLGRAVIPEAGVAKVKPGQSVDVKLTSFPFMEYGVLKGIVKSVSEIPDETGYVANIEFPEGLKSSFGIELTYIYEMAGTAEIITREVRLLQRFMQPMQSLFKNNVRK